MMSNTHRDIAKAVFARLVIAGHIFVSVWWVLAVTGQDQLWYFVPAVGVLFIETLACIVLKKGKGYKWFSTPIFCHLVAIIPCAWLIELYLFKERLNSKADSGLAHSNSTIKNELEEVISQERWTELIEQSALIMIILIRWLLPNDYLKKDSLSQLLLNNVATAYDIIEFFDLLKLVHVQQSKNLTVTILSLWSWSMMQFPFNTTASFEPRREAKNVKRPKRNQISPQIDKAAEENSPGHGSTSAANTESTVNELPGTVSCDFSPVEDAGMKGRRTTKIDIADEIARKVRSPRITADTIVSLISLLMQDGPFLAIRVFLIVYYQLFKYNAVFLTVKNALLLTLTIYRLYSLCFINGDREENDFASINENQDL